MGRELVVLAGTMTPEASSHDPDSLKKGDTTPDIGSADSDCEGECPSSANAARASGATVVNSMTAAQSSDRRRAEVSRGGTRALY